jgi:hypothetical protein
MTTTTTTRRPGRPRREGPVTPEAERKRKQRERARKAREAAAGAPAEAGPATCGVCGLQIAESEPEVYFDALDRCAVSVARWRVGSTPDGLRRALERGHTREEWDAAVEEDRT